jgi:hypothetical protein
LDRKDIYVYPTVFEKIATHFVLSGNGIYLSTLAAKEYLGIMALGREYKVRGQFR